MSTYAISVRRDGKFWFIDIPGVGATQARKLNEVKELAADYIAGMTDQDESSIQLDVAIELPTVVASHIAAAKALRESAIQAQAQALAETQAAATELQRDGLTVREIGAAMGLSYQRAQQLVSH